jgi:hypothetical protein
MTNLKNVLSIGLAAATVVVFLAVTISGGALRAGLAPWPGIGIIVLAAAAFVVSWKQKSYLVAGLLAASGVTGIIAGVINTQYFAVIMFPGPILGVIIGLGILGVGVAKGIITVRVAEIPARS